MMRIYLACPYSDPSPRVRRFRFGVVTEVAGLLMADGHHVYSPITHCHPIAEAVDLPKSFDYWRAYDLTFIDHWATHLSVLTLDGWERSKGVLAEMEHARGLGLPIDLLDLTHRLLQDRGVGRGSNV